MTTSGRARPGRFKASVFLDHEGGSVSVQWPGFIDFSDFGLPPTTSREYDFMAPLGQPFQVTLDGSTTNSNPWHADGESMRFSVSAWESRIETNGYQTYTFWDEVPVLLYDPATTATPEPGSILLIGSGLLVCVYRVRRNKIN